MSLLSFKKIMDLLAVKTQIIGVFFFFLYQKQNIHTLKCSPAEIVSCPLPRINQKSPGGSWWYMARHTILLKSLQLSRFGMLQPCWAWLRSQSRNAPKYSYCFLYWGRQINKQIFFFWSSLIMAKVKKYFLFIPELTKYSLTKAITNVLNPLGVCFSVVLGVQALAFVWPSTGHFLTSLSLSLFISKLG